MITRSPAPGHDDWKQELRAAARSPQQLVDALQLPPDVTAAAIPGSNLFPVRVPQGWLSRISPRDPEDPLLRQVLPLAAEQDATDGWGTDAVGDLDAMAVPGVIHKYHGRVLLIATGACAIHCRYCFRRHFPYGAATAAAGNWRDALAYVGSRSDINEVILSGGDPLTLDTARLAALTSGLRLIPQVRRLRIHTRIPVALPSRIDERLLEWLAAVSLQKVVVVHVNHPAELDDASRAALDRLRIAGVTLLNQSVLLAGVNDDADVLCELSESLFSAGVLPYYLHLLDRVQGAAHFEVAQDRARDLLHEVRRRLAGFLVPRLVREQRGEPYKLPVL